MSEKQKDTQHSAHMHKLADIIAAAVLLSLIAFAGLAITGILGASLGAVGTTWFALYSLIVVMSATKLYGKSVYEAVKGAGEGFLKMQDGGN
jgi:fatty-acid desaturase